MKAYASTSLESGGAVWQVKVGVWVVVVAGLACVPGILYFQRQACGVEAYPVEISPAIAIGLTISGMLGLFNGGLIFIRQPQNRIGRICILTAVVGLAATLANRYALCGQYGDTALPGQTVAAWISYVSAPLIIALFFWQIPFWFPYGQYLTSHWQTFAQSSWVVLLICLGVVAVLPGRMSDNGVNLTYDLVNPFGIALPYTEFLKKLLPRILVVFLILVSAAASLSLVLRYRTAPGDERKQIQWFAFIGGVVVILFLVIEIIAQLFDRGLLRSPIYVAGLYLAWIGYPAAIGISVLRYRLYDIDIVIRRTLSYTILSVTLGLIYLVSVTVIQRALTGFSRQNSESAVAISTLLIAALFTPLRRTIQASIDRRFYRSKYDAARTLEQFSATVREDVELESLITHLESVVEETLQPEKISLWLSPRK